MSIASTSLRLQPTKCEFCEFLFDFLVIAWNKRRGWWAEQKMLSPPPPLQTARCAMKAFSRRDHPRGEMHALFPGQRILVTMFNGLSALPKQIVVNDMQSFLMHASTPSIHPKNGIFMARRYPLEMPLSFMPTFLLLYQDQRAIKSCRCNYFSFSICISLPSPFRDPDVQHFVTLVVPREEVDFFFHQILENTIFSQMLT